mmetsp:Transcript_51460/g.123898  ORF Transcript_51460/g.123898 Transcript_51460/m.123898 type:complete len:333 (-) Transcript_51460:360-1358(-)
MPGDTDRHRQLDQDNLVLGLRCVLQAGHLRISPWWSQVLGEREAGPEIGPVEDGVVAPQHRLAQQPQLRPRDVLPEVVLTDLRLAARPRVVFDAEGQSHASPQLQTQVRQTAALAAGLRGLDQSRELRVQGLRHRDARGAGVDEAAAKVRGLAHLQLLAANAHALDVHQPVAHLRLSHWHPGQGRGQALTVVATEDELGVAGVVLNPEAKLLLHTRGAKAVEDVELGRDGKALQAQAHETVLGPSAKGRLLDGRGHNHADFGAGRVRLCCIAQSVAHAEPLRHKVTFQARGVRAVACVEAQGGGVAACALRRPAAAHGVHRRAVPLDVDGGL